MAKAPKRIRDKFVELAKMKEAKKAMEDDIKSLEAKCKEWFEKHKDEEGKLIIGHDGVKEYKRTTSETDPFMMPAKHVDYLRCTKIPARCSKIVSPPSA